jgi:hypothetical protein
MSRIVALTLYQVLVECGLDGLNRHIEQIIEPQIPSHHEKQFLEYVSEVKKSKQLDDKRFFVLMWYNTNQEYQQLIDRTEPKHKCMKFKEILAQKLDHAIAGVSETGEKYSKQTNKTHKFMHTLGYLLDTLRTEYIQL